MLIADTTLMRAALSIIGSWDAQARGRLNFDSLHAAWQATGLRNSDLRDAVRIMMARQLLEARTTEAGMELRLTAAGEELAGDTAVHVSHLITDLRDVVNLKRARQRAARRSGAPLPLDRRRSDVQAHSSGMNTPT